MGGWIYLSPTHAPFSHPLILFGFLGLRAFDAFQLAFVLPLLCLRLVFVFFGFLWVLVVFSA